MLMIIAKACVSSVVYFEYCVGILRARNPTFPPLRTKAHDVKDNHARPAQNMSLNIPMQPISAPLSQTRDDAALKKPPHSVALLVGFAMVARGEIGFLIAALSQSSGTLTYRLPNGLDDASSNEDLFLVVNWAVVLCTITGPLGVGLVVRRLKQQNTQITWLLEDQPLNRQQRPEHSRHRTNAGSANTSATTPEREAATNAPGILTPPR